MAQRDIAQEIINAVKSGSPDYVVTKLVQEREDKIKSQGLAGTVPTTGSILQTAAALASAGKNIVSGGSSTKESATRERETAAVQSGTQVHDSLENYDDFTLPLSYDYSSFSSGGSGSASMSKVVGYAVVGLVLLVVADKLIGK